MSDPTAPEPTVGVVIINPHNEVLLVKTHKWHDKYSVPGGHIEWGETILAAARRETREETGLEIRELEFLGWQECILDPQFWKPRHFIFFDYAARSEDVRVTLNDEAESYVWIDPEKALNELDLDSYTAVSIRTYLGRRNA